MDGRKLVTLLDAGEYITALPRKEHAAPEWLAAMEALILVAEERRTDDVCAHRRNTGTEPALRSGPLTRREKSRIGAGAS